MMTLYLTYLEIMFGEGAKWPVPTAGNFLQLVILIITLAVFTFYLKFYYSNKMKEIHEDQFFQFKARQKGLTDYQSKMVQGMARITRVKNPEVLLNDELQFENSITKFMNYLKSRNESRESLSSILKDIMITYEKIFHYTMYKKPLENLFDLEINILLSFFTEINDGYIGKLRLINREFLVIKLFISGNKLVKLKGQSVIVYFWRAGDAEYTFTSTVKKVEKNILEIYIPPEFIRSKEVYHPYVNVFIPCEIMIDISEKKEIAPVVDEILPEINQNEIIDRILSEEEIAGYPRDKEITTTETTSDLVANIVKINEHEAILRFENRIDYKNTYILNFDIGDFHYKIKASPVSDKVIEREHLYNYTFRFREISDNAHRVLKNFLSENLH